MIRFLLTLFLFSFYFSIQNVKAQNYEWAYSRDFPVYSAPSLFKVDDVGNFYTATFQGNYFLTSFTKAQIEKRSVSQTLLWQIDVPGNAYFSDIDFINDKIIVVGYFKGAITLNGTLFNSPTYFAGFMFECNTDGTFNWIKILDPYNSTFKPSSVFIAANSDIYLTAKIFNGNARSAFYKLDNIGNIVQSELPTRTDNETFSHIIADMSGNVYLTGTCGNNATFDNLLPNQTQSYQNFFIKYDNAFNAQYLITRKYFTFDDESKLFSNANHFFWAFHDIDINTNKDTVKVLKILPDGQIINSYNTPMADNNSGVYDFAMNKTCTQSAYINTTFLKLFVYKLDNNFNIVWKDTLVTGQTVPQKTLNVFCKEANFYVTSTFSKSFLDFNGINVNNLFAINLFVAKWLTGAVLPINGLNFSAVKNNDRVYLKWEIENHLNNAYFEIEKSFNAVDFSSIGKLHVVDLSLNKVYDYTDGKDLNRTIYYRIKIVDKSGNVSYSNVICIRNNNSIKIKVYPNPTAEQLSITFNASKAAYTTIEIFNELGAVVMKKQINLMSGSNYFSLGVSHIPAGNYFVKFSNAEISQYQKFQKR
jgi:hypothetical protein